jgi:L-amino acid N-acyltransferase YncA
VTPTHVRRAVPDDWPAIWSIFSAVVGAGDTYTFAPDTSEAEARRLWIGDGFITCVAEREGDIVGTYLVKPNQPGLGAHVANAGYMVRPDAFGGGIGAALCEHSLAEARAAGYRAMQFNAVVSTNTRAVELWKRLGFRIIGTVPEGFRHARLGYVDLHIMHRTLIERSPACTTG